MAIPLFFVAFGAMAQNTPKENIQLFFEAMHRKDTAAMRALTYGKIELKSIGKDKTGSFQITSEGFGEFLKSLASIPENVHFEEKIHAFEIKIDGNMAHVWTPYSFFVNEKLSHCGTNSFQLYKKDGNWKIISIIDTRRKENCGE